MFTRVINISSLEAAKDFVNLTTKYENVNMHLRYDNYEIDAHSIVAVLSIVDSENGLILTADRPADDRELLADIDPFIDKSAN